MYFIIYLYFINLFSNISQAKRRERRARAQNILFIYLFSKTYTHLAVSVSSVSIATPFEILRRCASLNLRVSARYTTLRRRARTVCARCRINSSYVARDNKHDDVSRNRWCYLTTRYSATGLTFSFGPAEKERDRTMPRTRNNFLVPCEMFRELARIPPALLRLVRSFWRQQHTPREGSKAKERSDRDSIPSNTLLVKKIKK